MHYYENLKTLRVQNRLSQQQVADILELKQQQYQRYESGVQEIPVHLLIKLADFYGVSTDYILGRAEASANNESVG